MADDLVVRASLQDDLSRPVRGVRKELDETTRSVRRLRDTSRTPILDSLTGGSRRLKDGLAGAHTRAMSLSQAVGRHLVSAARTGAIALGGLTAAAVGFGVRSASSLENATVAMESLTGSASAAQELLATIREIDPLVPFDRAQMTQVTVALLSAQVPLENIRGHLLGIADVAAGTADPQRGLPAIARAFTQMISLGRVSAEELNQLADAGVAVGPALEKAFGQSLQSVRSQMERGEDFPPEKLIEALFGIRAGTAERAATETLSGLWSGVRSRVTFALASESSPIVDDLKAAIPTIEAAVGGLLETVLPPLLSVASTLLDVVVRGLPIVAPVLTALAEGAETLVAAAGGAEALAPVADELAASLGELVRELAPEMPDLVDAFVALVMVLPEFVRLLADLAPFVGMVARLATNLLEMGGTRDVLAGLLVVLLGYRMLAGPIGMVWKMAEALMGFAQASRVAAGAQGAGGVAGAAGAAGGKGSRLGRFAKGGAAVGGGLLAVQAGEEVPGVGGRLLELGGKTAVGAGAGGIAGPWGALVGGGAGFLKGAWDWGMADGQAARVAASVPPASPDATTIDASTTIAPGGVQVNGTSLDEAQLQRAITAGISDYNRDRIERGTP